jgi:hypothetical protein
MRYKIGDRVRLKSIDWYHANKNGDGCVVISDDGYLYNLFFTKNDAQYCGKVFTISDIVDGAYVFEEMETGYYYCDEMIDGLEDETTTEHLKITYELFHKLPSQQIEHVKFEDIPNKIVEILSKTLKTQVNVKGNGITEEINITIGKDL